MDRWIWACNWEDGWIGTLLKISKEKMHGLWLFSKIHKRRWMDCDFSQKLKREDGRIATLLKNSKEKRDRLWLFSDSPRKAKTKHETKCHETQIPSSMASFSVTKSYYYSVLWKSRWHHSLYPPQLSGGGPGNWLLGLIVDYLRQMFPCLRMGPSHHSDRAK